jgi:hypothetical protein
MGEGIYKVRLIAFYFMPYWQFYGIEPDFPFEYVPYSNIFFITTNEIEIENIY